MAKKSKNKRRRYQVKKSKRGQNRKRRPKRSEVLPSKDSNGSLRNRDSTFMQAIVSDGLVVQDGYRIVDPAQAMMDHGNF